MTTWIIYQPPRKSPTDFAPGAQTQCPHCKALDTIAEVDRATRWNTLTLSSNGATATAMLGSGDWEGDGWICTACLADDLVPPDGFEILDWY